MADDLKVIYDWQFLDGGEITLPNGDALVFALGRYGDVYGPLPVELFDPEAWKGNMLNASHDLIAVAPFGGKFRDAIPHAPVPSPIDVKKEA